jgi:hypothetical protein
MDISFVARGDFFPEIDHSVLKVHELPEKRLVDTRITVPVLVLSSWNSVQVQNYVQVFCCATLDNSVKDAKSFGFDDTRAQIVFKMPVIERNANAVQSLLREEFGIGCCEEVVKKLAGMSVKTFPQINSCLEITLSKK